MVAGVLLQHVILIKKLLMGDAAVFVRSGSVNIVVDGKEKCAKIFRVSDTLTKNIYYKPKDGKPIFYGVFRAWKFHGRGQSVLV